MSEPRRIQPGDTVPDVTLRLVGPDDTQTLHSTEVLGPGRGRVLLFAVPGAFTSTCTDVHLPGYIARLDDLLAAGVDHVACIATNDHEVVAAWAKARQIPEAILLLADGNADFARAMGLDIDLSPFGMGTRSRRYAALFDDGVLRYLAVEPGPGVSVSGAEEMLKVVREE